MSFTVLAACKFHIIGTKRQFEVQGMSTWQKQNEKSFANSMFRSIFDRRSGLDHKKSGSGDFWTNNIQIGRHTNFFSTLDDSLYWWCEPSLSWQKCLTSTTSDIWDHTSGDDWVIVPKHSCPVRVHLTSFSLRVTSWTYAEKWVRGAYVWQWCSNISAWTDALQVVTWIIH